MYFYNDFLISMNSTEQKNGDWQKEPVLLSFKEPLILLNTTNFTHNVPVWCQSSTRTTANFSQE